MGGNAYGYDANGSLTNAEGRDYDYDLENRLWRLREGGSALRTLEYDADGVLRASTNELSQKTLFVTPDYQINLATGEVSVHYRFGGRGVAWRNSWGLRYLPSDHLSSTHAEAGENQADLAQRRYLPFGSDRSVSGASDLSTGERFTSQRRSDDGNGNSRRELYYYRARWYLPGVGIFTQPDTIVPDYKNPQALNRFSYGYNNPVKYNDYAYRFFTMAWASGMVDKSLGIDEGFPIPDHPDADIAENIEYSRQGWFIGEKWAAASTPPLADSPSAEGFRGRITP